MKLIRLKIKQLFCLLLINVLCVPLHASNGLKLISSGTRSAGMGGADFANSTDTSVLNSNPALMTQFDSPHMDAHSGTVYLFDLGHSDQFGSSKVSNKFAHLVDLGYVSKFKNAPLNWGVGMFFAGGLGVEYDNINTAFQNRDDLTSTIGLINFTPSIAYQFNEKLSLGATFLATYIIAEQKIFPNTSVVDRDNPQRSFFGSRFKDADDFGYGLRLGMQYKINDQLNFGAVYSSQIDLNPQSSSYQVNMSALGLGTVKYSQLNLSGLNFPEEIGLGLEFKANPKLSLAADISWLNWSEAVESSTLIATGPDNPLAPQKISSNLALNWKNQYVFSLGLAYQYKPDIELRVGYNHARAPVRKQTLSPILSPHAEHHLGFGYGKKYASGWNADFAAVYTFNEKIHYTNPDLPFGPSVEEGESIQFEFTLGYDF